MQEEVAQQSPQRLRVCLAMLARRASRLDQALSRQTRNRITVAALMPSESRKSIAHRSKTYQSTRINKISNHCKSRK